MRVYHEPIRGSILQPYWAQTIYNNASSKEFTVLSANTKNRSPTPGLTSSLLEQIPSHAA